MTWQFTEDVETFALHAVPLLAADPVRHTVPLTVIESARARHGPLDEPELFGWWTSPEGRVAGTVSHTRPYDLLLGVVPDAAMRPLVHALHDMGHHVEGVTGAAAAAAQFAAIRVRDLGGRADLHFVHRLHRLHELCPPRPMPPGMARGASSEDRHLLVEWLEGFAAEAGLPFAPHVIDERLGYGGLTIWSDAAGQPVSLAGRTRPAAEVARVGPVYTPTQQRNRGFGAAVTHAVTEAALAAGADAVVLFTDVTNPTSNAIYQRLSYRAVSDNLGFRFVR